MRFYTVEFVYRDEATPRESHTRTVKAIDFAEARKAVQVEAILRGDRIVTSSTELTTSYR